MRKLYDKLSDRVLIFTYLCRAFIAGAEMLVNVLLSYCWGSGMLGWTKIEMLRERQTIESPALFILIGICTLVQLWREGHKRGKLFYAKEAAEVALCGIWVLAHAIGIMNTPTGLYAEIALYGLILGLNIKGFSTLIRKKNA